MCLTLQRLHECFQIEPDTGKLFWKISRHPMRVGVYAGSFDNRGYRIVKIDGYRYKVHRLMWFWVYGEFPTGDLDHINGDKGDNRIVNLRIATKQENQWNCGQRKNNTSGYRGVNKCRGKWQAKININGKRRHLGGFRTAEEASVAYMEAAKKYHGKFYRSEQNATA